MKRLTIRQARVGDLLKQTIAELILRRVKDPRVEGVIITEVEVSVDLKLAHVYFCIHDADRIAAAHEGLERAEGFLHRELLKTLRMKTVPRLSFSYDPSFDYGSRIDEILDGIAHDKDPHR